MKVFRYLLIIFVGLTSLRPAFAQEAIPNYLPGTKNPRKATLLSLALPGLGQAYNEKYWKIPLVYAGLGATGYFALSSRQEYRKFKAAYQYKVFNLPGDPPNEYASIYTADQLRVQRDYYRRNMEFNFILMGVVYILNLVDAAVDAHLSAFDISDELSVQLLTEPLLPLEGPGGRGALSVRISCSF